MWEYHRANNMWRISPTECWLHDVRVYSERRPEAVAVVIRNLARYLKLLRAAKVSKDVEASYLQDEGEGIVSVSQVGLGNFDEDLRIYTFADDTRCCLYLLMLGQATARNADMAYSKDFVFWLLKRTESKM